MSDFRDDPAFLRDEVKRQAALATGAMAEADALREKYEAMRLEWSKAIDQRDAALAEVARLKEKQGRK